MGIFDWLSGKIKHSKMKKKIHFESGNIREEYEVTENGKRHGVTKTYHENGQLQVEVNFTNGIQDEGEIISYHDNGVKARQVIRLNGEFNGEYIEWYKNGQKKLEGTYKNGNSTIIKEWSEDGVLFDYKKMKFDNETIREAVLEWYNNENKAKKIYGHITNWDTSEVTDMNNLFSNDESFNQPIGAWDVSNVTSMYAMFGNAFNFNQPLNNWNVSKVENLSFMFSSSESMKFNQPLDNWDVSNVTNMEYMFICAESFNQPIGNWDVSNVTNMDNMFSKAKSFNQSLDNWDVSDVTNMLGMFYGAESFNQPLDNWNVSKVTNMSGMFYGAESFNQPIGDWDVSNVTDMNSMFYEAKSFNQSIGNWDMSRVTNKKDIFFLANYEMISKYGDNGEKINSIDSVESNRFLSSWSTQELRGMHNLFKGLIFETYPMTDKKHKSRLGAMIGFFQIAFCSNQDTYSFVDNKTYQNFVKEIQLDEILPSKEGINSLVDLNKRKKNELLFIVTILITQSDVGWDEVFETESFNLIRKMLAIEFNEDSYNKMNEIYCEDDDKRLDSL